MKPLTSNEVDNLIVNANGPFGYVQPNPNGHGPYCYVESTPVGVAKSSDWWMSLGEVRYALLFVFVTAIAVVFKDVTI